MADRNDVVEALARVYGGKRKVVLSSGAISGYGSAFGANSPYQPFAGNTAIIWYAGVLDMDIENGRFYWNAQTYANETALLAAMSNASKTVGARSIGPYVFGTERMSDPEFSSSTSGIVDAPTTAANGTPSQASDRLVITFDSVGNNYRCRVPLTGLVARRAFYAEAQMATNAGIDAISVNLSNNTDLGGAAAASFNIGALPNTQGVVFGNPGTTMYAGFNSTDAALNGSGTIEYFRVKECSPFNGFMQDTLAGYVKVTTPSTFGSTKVCFELGDDALTRERIRIEVSSTGVATFIVTNDSAVQASIALGTWAVSTVNEVWWSCGPNRVVAKANTSASVADVSSSTPGLGRLYIGRSSSGETWDTGSDLIRRVQMRATEYLPIDAVYMEGDSYAAGAGGVSLPTTANADNRAMVTTAVGGATLAEARARVQANPGLAANGVFIIWDGNGVNGFTDVAGAMADYAAMVAALGHARFIIISPLKRNNLTSQNNTDMGNLQVALAATYPNNYINAQSILASHATSPGDDADVAAGVVPTSLLQGDLTHLISSAMGYVWGDPTGVKAALTSKGW